MFSFSAVQSHRDTYGKRNLPSLDDSSSKNSVKTERHQAAGSKTDLDHTYLPGAEAISSTSKAVSYPQMSNTAIPSTTSSTAFTDTKTYPILELRVR